MNELDTGQALLFRTRCSTLTTQRAVISPCVSEVSESLIWDIRRRVSRNQRQAFCCHLLYLLDAIYAQECLDLAPHALMFDVLENAQCNVLEALAFRVGSTIPIAFMAALWDALPTLLCNTLLGALTPLY
ncbi:uncharacterized protein TRAVEDRAFT_52648 [Trametes versicolor FP-101664 SS1]|uniref:uncharacterized protein n=1 Tax=Trametes versicolor (strain FP-101664) TaxID=717944 RepID=UPI0004622D46|nr:uncharacterized protein TRAVEDRAFT_52648 [Trametes versicolor FP-101664 SS1]EIW53521.1 hypothetical protein TRAVEDRAFT_52648 [Trametes versicolor FP-101664 SS1]